MNDVNVGDMVVLDKAGSPIHNVECTVGHVDATFIILMSGMHKNVFIVSDPADFEHISVKRKGKGALDEQQVSMLKEVMSKWVYTTLFTSIGSNMHLMRKISKPDGDDEAYINIGGFVSKNVVSKWRQLLAMTDLLKKVNPDIPDIQAVMLEWMLLSALNMVNSFPEIKRKYEQGGL